MDKSKESQNYPSKSDTKKLIESMLNKPTDKSSSEKLKTFPVGNSSILDKVKVFLPQIQESNLKLQNIDDSDINIENISEDCDKYIEMTISCVEDKDNILEQLSASDDASSSSDTESGEDQKKDAKKPLIEEI